MNTKLLFYVLALAFQISGAVLLIIKYWGKTTQRVIDVYFPGTGIASNDGENNAVLEVKRVRECVIEIYANRMAFIYIAVGYFFSVFGEKVECRNIAILLSTGIISIILIALEKVIASILANKLYREDLKISYKDLPGHIDTTMGKKDIDEIINGIYKD